MTTLAVFQMALALLPLIETGTEQFVLWLNTLKAELQRTGEWTPEQDAAFTAALEAEDLTPEFQPDPPSPPAGS